MTASSHGVEIQQGSTKPEVWYYVETAITKPLEPTIAEQTTFRAHLVRATKPKEAERLAIKDAWAHHRNAAEITFFMSRRLTDAKAAKIQAQFDAGTWEGWRF